MNAFGAAVAGDSESRDTRLHTKAVDLFVDRHQRKDIVDSLLNRQLRIKKRVLVLLPKRRQRKECNEYYCRRTGKRADTDFHFTCTPTVIEFRDNAKAVLLC